MTALETVAITTSSYQWGRRERQPHNEFLVYFFPFEGATPNNIVVVASEQRVG